MTLAQDAYLNIRRDIVLGKLAPGQPLRLAQLRDRYRVGFSPLREALTRLASEHLVVSEALKGFHVARISLDELRDNMQTRIFIETEALRRSTERGGDEWEMGIVSALHALKLQAKRAKSAEPDEFERLERCHFEFHRALVAACGSRWLLDFFTALYTVSERYRVPVLRASSKVSGRDLDKEHSDLADAALAHDADLAVRLLEQHYSKTTDMIESIQAPAVSAAFK